jgi:glucosamine--fructose-6-phosphate aminotransferase (isomerizing)
MLRADAAHAADVAPYEQHIDPADGVIVLSHTAHTGYSMQVLERARAAGAAVVHISGIGNGGDVETVEPEQSYAYTASHTGALLRLAQIASALGAQLGALDAIPDSVAAVLTRPGPLIEIPQRLVELIGAGPNAWTAQEGALKIREASYVATEGLSSEQFFHGPSVALDAQDTLVVLDGGGPAAERTEAIARAVEATGAKVVRFAERDLGEALSVFPLTVIVQRIALELAEARGVSPDRFRYEEDPGRQKAFENVGF